MKQLLKVSSSNEYCDGGYENAAVDLKRQLAKNLVKRSVGRLLRDLVWENKIIGQATGGINHQPTPLRMGLEISRIFD